MKTIFLRGLLLAGLLMMAVAGRAGLAQATEPHHEHARPVAQAPADAGEQTAPDATVAEKKEQVKDENEEYLHSPVVMKLGKMMGMGPVQASTTFTIFNFLVLAVALGFVLVKTLPKTFRDRSTHIQKQLVEARTATEEANARLNSVEERLSKLDAQIADMRSHAEAEAERDEKRIKASLEDETAKIVASAEAEIVSATALAQRQIQQYAAELAIDQAARKLIVTAETDRLLVESFAHRLGSDKGEQN